MRNEVEEFLKRVAQVRAEVQARAAQPRADQAPGAPQPGPPSQPPPPSVVPARLTPTPMTSAYESTVDAEIVDAELAEAGDSVGRHVTEHLRGTERIAEHTRCLGEEVDQADDRLEARLHEVFDHNVGRLRKSATDVAAVSASDFKRTGLTAGSIAGMLLTPETIRTAMILGEILKRPDERE